MRIIALTAILVTALSSNAQADVVLTPGDINGGGTAANYDDAFVTLTPQVRDAGGVLVGSTFNNNAARLGIDGNGTNNNAFNDANQTFGDAGDEALLIEFKGNAGFRGITWDFSRADGPAATDGIQFSGFLFDPGAVLSGGGAVDSSSVSYAAGVVTLQLAGADFGDPDGVLTFSNSLASEGQAIQMTVADSTQAGAQFAVTSFTYDAVAVPEPGTAGLVVAIACCAGFVRRRK